MTTEINQCDGCRRGLPHFKGTHYNLDGSYDAIGCTARKYGAEPLGEALTGRPRFQARFSAERERAFAAIRAEMVRRTRRPA
jgi:hypothetical protein